MINKFAIKPEDRKEPTIFDLLWGHLVLMPTKVGIVNTPEVQSIRAEGSKEGFAVEMFHMGTEIKQFELVFHRPGDGESDFYLVVLGDGQVVGTEFGMPQNNGVASYGMLFEGMRYGAMDLVDVITLYLAP